MAKTHEESGFKTERNLMKTNKYQIFYLLICLGIALGCGQKDSKSIQPVKTNPTQTGPTALWKSVLKKYAQLPSYRDSAEITLQYQLGESGTVEVQPSNVLFHRNSQTWAAHSFRTFTWTDQSRFFQSILEPSTGNLDNQVLNGPKNKWQTVFRDVISKIYLSGQTDFPTAKSNQQYDWPALFCPQLALLSPSPCEIKPFYIHTNASVEKVGAEKLGKFFCHILKISFQGKQAFFWVEPETNWIHKAEFESSLLLEELTSTVEVRNIKLGISFRKISETTQKDVSEFHPPLKPQDRSVTQFTKIPERLPSPWIGKPSPQIQTRLSDGKTWDLDQFHGRPVVAVFPSPSPNRGHEEWLKSLQQISQQGKYSRAEYVLGNFQGFQKVSPTTTGGVSFVPDARRIRETLQLPLGDTIVVWDGHGVIQYVGEVKEKNLQQKVKGLLERLDQGESIAFEMRSEYEKYYQTYLTELTKSAGLKLEIARQKPASSSSPESISRADSPTFDSRSLKLEKLWVRTIQSPNFVRTVLIDGQLEVWVLNGFRTIDVFDEGGRALRTIRLQLPGNLSAQYFYVDTFAAEPRIFTLDPGSDSIYQFDLTGKQKFKIEGPSGTQIDSFQITKTGQVFWQNNLNNTIIRFDLQKNRIVDRWKFMGKPGQLLVNFVAIPKKNTNQSQQTLALNALVVGKQGERYGLYEGSSVRTLSPSIQINRSIGKSTKNSRPDSVIRDSVLGMIPIQDSQNSSVSAAQFFQFSINAGKTSIQLLRWNNRSLQSISAYQNPEQNSENQSHNKYRWNSSHLLSSPEAQRVKGKTRFVLQLRGQLYAISLDNWKTPFGCEPILSKDAKVVSSSVITADNDLFLALATEKGQIELHKIRLPGGENSTDRQKQ